MSATRDATGCVECGAPLPASGDCGTRVHELLEIEGRVLPELAPEAALRAHFFAIAAYQLQHPFRLTAEAAATLRGAVAEMLRPDARPVAELRASVGRTVGRGKVARAADPGDREHLDGRWPRTWLLTVTDVGAAPDAEYPAAVERWARQTTDVLDEAVGGSHD